MTVQLQHLEPESEMAVVWERFNLTVFGVLFVFAYLYCVDVAYVVGW